MFVKIYKKFIFDQKHPQRTKFQKNLEISDMP